MMRILMFNNEFPPIGGGTGVVNEYLLREIARYPDVWVDLVTSSPNLGNYKREQFSERIRIFKVPVRRTNIHHASNLELVGYARRGFRLSNLLMRENRYDLSFAFSGVPAGGISYALNKFYKLPYIVSLQGPDVPGFEVRYNYLYPFLQPVLRQIWGKAVVVTAISEEHRRLAHETMPDLDIPIIYNGVDTRAFCPPEGGRDPQDVNILCVGRLIARKGQHHLLKAFAQLRRITSQQVRLTLVGTGDAEGDLKALARRLAIADAVEFTGFVPHEDMPEVYRQADILVLPSQSEGMSIALLEAMASGLPVVVTDTGGSKELVVDGENGYVVPWGDIAGLGVVLQRLLEDRPLRTKLCKESRRIAQNFGWDAFTEQYLTICREVAR